MGRTPCCDKASVKRGPWSPEEDATLKRFVQTHGTGGNWISLPRKAGLNRCGKSCRLRWLNYLRPDIKHGGFTQEEDNIICCLYNQIGSRWSVIASQLPGRTDNDVKNHWNTKLKKKHLAEKSSPSSNSSNIFYPTNSINNPKPLASEPSFPSPPNQEAYEITFSSSQAQNSMAIPIPTYSSSAQSIHSQSPEQFYYPRLTLPEFGTSSCSSGILLQPQDGSSVSSSSNLAANNVPVLCLENEGALMDFCEDPYYSPVNGFWFEERDSSYYANLADIAYSEIKPQGRNVINHY